VPSQREARVLLRLLIADEEEKLERVRERDVLELVSGCPRCGKDTPLECPTKDRVRVALARHANGCSHNTRRRSRLLPMSSEEEFVAKATEVAALAVEKLVQSWETMTETDRADAIRQLRKTRSSPVWEALPPDVRTRAEELIA
jgi:hypothetical protein